MHFTNWRYALKAQFILDPSEPTALLFKRTPGGGYELRGAMYTAPKRSTEEKQLDQRVPLSIARWHTHEKICLPRRRADPATVDWSRCGASDSIATEQQCDAADGRFILAPFGWTVHIYPWETRQKAV